MDSRGLTAAGQEPRTPVPENRMCVQTLGLSGGGGI